MEYPDVEPERLALLKNRKSESEQVLTEAETLQIFNLLTAKHNCMSSTKIARIMGISSFRQNQIYQSLRGDARFDLKFHRGEWFVCLRET